MLNLSVLNETFTNGLSYTLLSIIVVSCTLCGIFVIVSKNPIVSVSSLMGLFLNYLKQATAEIMMLPVGLVVVHLCTTYIVLSVFLSMCFNTLLHMMMGFGTLMLVWGTVFKHIAMFISEFVPISYHMWISIKKERYNHIQAKNSQFVGGSVSMWGIISTVFFAMMMTMSLIPSLNLIMNSTMVTLNLHSITSFFGETLKLGFWVLPYSVHVMLELLYFSQSGFYLSGHILKVFSHYCSSFLTKTGYEMSRSMTKISGTPESLLALLPSHVKAMVEVSQYKSVLFMMLPHLIVPMVLVLCVLSFMELLFVGLSFALSVYVGWHMMSSGSDFNLSSVFVAFGFMIHYVKHGLVYVGFYCGLSTGFAQDSFFDGPTCSVLLWMFMTQMFIFFHSDLFKDMMSMYMM